MKNMRKDLLSELPLPARLCAYLTSPHYYSELIDQCMLEDEHEMATTPATLVTTNTANTTATNNITTSTSNITTNTATNAIVGAVTICTTTSTTDSSTSINRTNTTAITTDSIEFTDAGLTSNTRTSNDASHRAVDTGTNIDLDSQDSGSCQSRADVDKGHLSRNRSSDKSKNSLKRSIRGKVRQMKDALLSKSDNNKEGLNEDSDLQQLDGAGKTLCEIVGEDSSAGAVAFCGASNDMPVNEGPELGGTSTNRPMHDVQKRSENSLTISCGNWPPLPIFAPGEKTSIQIEAEFTKSADNCNVSTNCVADHQIIQNAECVNFPGLTSLASPVVGADASLTSQHKAPLSFSSYLTSSPIVKSITKVRPCKIVSYQVDLESLNPTVTKVIKLLSTDEPEMTGYSSVDDTALCHAAVDGTALCPPAVDGTALCHAAVDVTALCHAAVGGIALCHAAVDGTALCHAAVDGTALCHAAVDGTALSHAAVDGTALCHAAVDGAAQGKCACVDGAAQGQCAAVDGAAQGQCADVDGTAQGQCAGVDGAAQGQCTVANHLADSTGDERISQVFSSHYSQLPSLASVTTQLRYPTNGEVELSRDEPIVTDKSFYSKVYPSMEANSILLVSCNTSEREETAGGSSLIEVLQTSDKIYKFTTLGSHSFPIENESVISKNEAIDFKSLLLSSVEGTTSVNSTHASVECNCENRCDNRTQCTCYTQVEFHCRNSHGSIGCCTCCVSAVGASTAAEQPLVGTVSSLSSVILNASLEELGTF